jgi:hypothetical protein
MQASAMEVISQDVMPLPIVITQMDKAVLVLILIPTVFMKQAVILTALLWILRAVMPVTPANVVV